MKYVSSALICFKIAEIRVAECQQVHSGFMSVRIFPLYDFSKRRNRWGIGYLVILDKPVVSFCVSDQGFKRKKIEFVIRNEDYVFYVLAQAWKNKLIEQLIAQLKVLIILIVDDFQILGDLVLDRAN